MQYKVYQTCTDTYNKHRNIPFITPTTFMYMSISKIIFKLNILYTLSVGYDQLCSLVQELVLCATLIHVMPSVANIKLICIFNIIIQILHAFHKLMLENIFNILYISLFLHRIYCCIVIIYAENKPFAVILLINCCHWSNYLVLHSE